MFDRRYADLQEVYDSEVNRLPAKPTPKTPTDSDYERDN